jgi:hypothetical protein
MSARATDAQMPGKGLEGAYGLMLEPKRKMKRRKKEKRKIAI